MFPAICEIKQATTKAMSSVSNANNPGPVFTKMLIILHSRGPGSFLLAFPMTLLNSVCRLEPFYGAWVFYMDISIVIGLDGFRLLS